MCASVRARACVKREGESLSVGKKSKELDRTQPSHFHFTSATHFTDEETEVHKRCLASGRTSSRGQDYS